MLLRIGIFASELIKVICGKPLEELNGFQLRELTSKAIRAMESFGLNCTEFLVGFNQLREIVKVTANEDGMDFLLHEVGEFSATKLSYIDETARGKIVDGLKETIDYASEGGFRALTIHPATYNPGKPGYAYSGEAGKYLKAEEAWKVSMELLKRLVSYAERRGVMLGLENMPVNVFVDGEVLETPHFGKSRCELLRIISSVGTGMKITFDVGHANTVCQPADYIKGIVGMVTHIHLHDSDGRYDQHAPLGMGTVNLNSLFKVLAHEEYKSSIVIERGVDEDLIEDLSKLKHLIFKYVKKC